MNLVVEQGLVRVTARDFPVNQGGLCQKGWTAADLLDHPDRLTSPMIRDNKGGPLRPATWDQALDRIINDVRSLQRKCGNDSVGVFGGGGLTNEKAYALGKFARVALKTAMIDYNGRFCMSSAAAALNKSLGMDRGLPFPLADIPRAETILLVGSNVAETLPLAMRYFEEQRAHGGSLIVVDPRKTNTASNAALHLQITPGTDAALANGLLHILIRKRYVDADYIRERTNGFDKVKQAVLSYWPARVERITGVSERQLEEAAHLLGRARKTMILTARGPEQQSRGVDNVLSFINLALALGTVGKPFSGYGTLTGQGNGQGGREHGLKADQLPGYRKLDNPEHRRHIAAIWGVKEEDLPQPGRSAYELLDTLGTDSGLKGLFVFASNVAVSAPHARHVEAGLKKLDLLVVSDFFLSETAALADVVLPCLQWAEESGTMTNLEGRILLRVAAVPPPQGARSDLAILASLADRLGQGDKFSPDPSLVYDELRRASAGGLADYSGATYEKIRKQAGVFWPCPNEDHPGTPRLFEDRFPTPDGRAQFNLIEFLESSEQPDAEYPLFLTTGRVLAQYQSGTQTRRVERLNKLSGEAFVEIHPATARGYGISNSDPVELTTRRGQAVFKAVLTPTIRLDTVFVPFHFAGSACANLLTNPKLDPSSRMPDFKVCAVRVKKNRSC